VLPDRARDPDDLGGDLSDQHGFSSSRFLDEKRVAPPHEPTTDIGGNMHVTRLMSVPRICALLAALSMTALPYAAEAAPTKSKTSSKSSSQSSSSSSKTKSTPRAPARATPAAKTQKTTVCCAGCDACRKRAAINGVKVK
jgi:hypothetical protein